MREFDIDSDKYLQVLQKAFCKHYEEKSDVWTTEQEMRVIASLIHGQLKLKDSIHALDVGCGMGLDTHYFSQIYAHATGLDLYSHANWQELETNNNNINFVNSDLLSFQTKAQFSLIFDNGCFHHQHPSLYQPYLKKLGSLLDLESYLVLSTFKNTSQEDIIDENGRLHKYFSDEELHLEIAQAGFQLVDEIDVFRNKSGDYYRVSFLVVLD